MNHKLKRRTATVLAFLFASVYVIGLWLPEGQAMGGKPEAASLDAIHYVKGDKLYLEFRVKGVTLKAPKIGAKAEKGKGYIALLIDDEEVAQIDRYAYVYKGLKPGKHVVKIVLKTLDHKPYGVEHTFPIDVQ